MAETPTLVPGSLPRFLGWRASLARFGPAWRWARRLRCYARFLSRRPHDPDFAAFAKLSGDGLFLDIGASAGQSAYSFRLYKPHSSILSLEPLADHRSDLEFVGRVLPGFTFLMEGAAACTMPATLYVPRFRHYDLPAYSSLSLADAQARLARLVSAGAEASRFRLREVPVQLRRVDELGLAPAFIKIDVEGAEFDVLKGMAATLAAHHPVLMIEKTAQAGEWSEWLEQSFAYRAHVFDHASGRFLPWRGGHPMNLFFLRH